MLDAPDGEIVAINREAVQLWGIEIDSSAMHGSDIHILDQDGQPIPGDRQHPLMRPLLTRELECGVEMTTVGGSGDVVDVLADLSPIIGPNADLLGAVAVLQRRELLQPGDHVKDEFISVVAHELQNPLTSLRGNMQLLERRLRRVDGPAVGQELERVSGVIEQVDRVEELVRRMLDVSRADLGTLTIDPVGSDAVELAKAAMREIEGQADGRSVTLEAPDAVVVHWDHVRVQQILINLLTNALRYAPDGDIRIVIDADDSSDRVTISVRDFGPGVPLRLRRRLFHLYYRLDDGNEPTYGSGSQHRGLGIGLFISARLAKAHGGSLQVEDAEGGGARFALSLPRKVDESAA